MITYTRITFEEAKNMLDEGGCIMFDVRTDEEFFTGHAEGAVNFDVDTINDESAAELIPNKDTPIIVYCKTGQACRRSAVRARLHKRLRRRQSRRMAVRLVI